MCWSCPAIHLCGAAAGFEAHEDPTSPCAANHCALRHLILNIVRKELRSQREADDALLRLAFSADTHPVSMEATGDTPP